MGVFYPIRWTLEKFRNPDCGQGKGVKPQDVDRGKFRAEHFAIKNPIMWTR